MSKNVSDEPKRSISAGTACIIVKDPSLFEGGKSDFAKWLRREGFAYWNTKGFFPNVDWFFVNIHDKVYAGGLPGYKVTEPMFEHAVTIEEFKTIYGIFTQYEGLSVLEMEPPNPNAQEPVRQR